MVIDRISYQRVFAIGNYVTERIGLEASLDANDNPQTELEHLKIIVNDLHSATIATLEETRGTTVRDIAPVDRTIQGIIEDIGNCTVVDEKNHLGVQVGLLSYLNIAMQHPELQEPYDRKMAELTGKPYIPFKNQ